MQLNHSTGMFEQPVKLQAPAAVPLASVSIVDGPANRRTLRSSSDDNIQLSIAHNESNENPGFVNRRSNVRITMGFPVDDSDKTVKAYAQLTTSCPLAVVTAAQLATLVGALINFVHYGENADEYNTCNASALGDQVARLYAGEP